MPTQHASGRLPLMLAGFLTAAAVAEAGTARYVDTRNAYNGNGLSGAPAASNDGPGAFNSVSSANAATYALGDDIYFACNSASSRTTSSLAQPRFSAARRTTRPSSAPIT